MEDVLRKRPITLAVDFDGVIHKYRRGWDDGTIYDEPIDGVKEALQRLLNQGHKIAIYSMRCFDREVLGEHYTNQVEEIILWLTKYKIPYTYISRENKPLAHVFIDDRALRFEGSWSNTLLELSRILKDIP